MTTTKPAITAAQWLDIANSGTVGEITAQLMAFDENSVRLVAEERYGTNWGQHIVMHTGDHEWALEVLLERPPTALETWDSLSGRRVVPATNTTGMGTINAAKKKVAASNPPAEPPVVTPPPPPPVVVPPTPPSPPSPPVVEPPPLTPPPMPGPPPRATTLSPESKQTITDLRKWVSTWKSPKGKPLFGKTQQQRVNAMFDEVEALLS